MLLKHKCDIYIQENYGMAPLYFAVIKKRFDILMCYGANINDLDNQGNNALLSELQWKTPATQY